MYITKTFANVLMFSICFFMLSNLKATYDTNELDNLKEVTFAMDHGYELQKVKVDQKQLECMAKNIYFESRGEPILGQIAVARVVMNRLQHGFANTPCKVIYQSKSIIDLNTRAQSKICQFSWVCQNLTSLDKRTDEYKNALKIAFDVLAYDLYQEVIPSNVVFFHSVSVKPKWPYKKYTKIGNHIFYMIT